MAKEISDMTPEEALDHFLPSGDAAQPGSDGPDTDHDGGGNADDASTSSSEPAATEGNPYEAGGEPTSEKEDDRPVVNLKAEFDRKTARLEQQLAAMGEANRKQLDAVTTGFQSALDRIGKMFETATAKPPAPDPISKLDPDDPDYEVKVLRLELRRTQDDLNAYKQEGAARRQERQQQQQFNTHRQTVSSITTQAVENAVKGTPLADNNGAKGILWDTAYRAIAAVNGDPSRVAEVSAAVVASRDLLLALGKNGSPPAAHKQPASRQPIGSRASPPSRVGGKAQKSIDEMDDNEFNTAVQAQLNSVFGPE